MCRFPFVCLLSLTFLWAASSGCENSEAPAPVAPSSAEPAAINAHPSAQATTATRPQAAAECGGKSGAECGNPDCIYAGEKKTGKALTSGKPDPDCPHLLGDPTKAPAATASHFGAVFSLEKKSGLAQVLGGPDLAVDQVVQVTGTIDKVCKKKGCWMVIKDGATVARVLMRNYGFTVPLDCDGKQAIVEGTVKTRTFTEAQVKHLAEDGGEDPSKVSGTRKEHVVTAHGIRIDG